MELLAGFIKLATVGIRVVSDLVIDSVAERAVNPTDEFCLKNVRYRGLENSEFMGRIIISNHSCFLDYAIVKRHVDCYCVANIRTFMSHAVTDDELFNRFKIIAYDYSPSGGVKVKRRILDVVNSGQNVLVFPEGYSVRSSSRSEVPLKPFKRGLFHLAYENGIPIVPVSQWHYNNTNIHYFDHFLDDVILGRPIQDMNVDVFIGHEINPSECDSFEAFYDRCFRSVQENLKPFRL
jgi:1-acyl-sn-glycerol-3-phosphate acyltransferase